MPTPDDTGSVYPGADEKTPSLAQYFSWINNTNEGATEEQTLVNLAFFKWLRDEYGMQLDIYAFDAGAIDGSGFYGSTKSARFKRQFPNGFGPMAEAAAGMGCRLGIWGGPDGFGDTEEEAHERIETMVSLCRDHNFILFKFDSVCGKLRSDKIDYFIEMMTRCREYSPDLILLNHRLELGRGLPHATTFLWEGMETYVDVFCPNPVPAPHNRAGTLHRGLPPELKRLTEDHGVCLSSCLDYWEDDLILQAFSRCLILSPELYGNPWLLNDDEFPRLARIFNLHRRYRDILVNGILLPEDPYGPYAVSRGDGRTRFVTLRNLTWEPVTVPLTLDESIGMEPGEKAEVRRLHPRETVIGRLAWGDEAEVVVEPFRSCLVMVTTGENREIGFHGCDGEIIRDVDGRDAELKLWGRPGTSATVHLGAPGMVSATLDGAEKDGLLEEPGVSVEFPGEAPAAPWHRKLGDLSKVEVPEDAVALYEGTCFAADNNALEARELKRSGPTQFEAVQRARDAFFNQATFRNRGIWDRNMFDDDPETFFAVERRHGDIRVRGGSLRIDFGEPVEIDRLVLQVGGDYNLQPLKNQEAVQAWVSSDLKQWTLVRGYAEDDIEFIFKNTGPIRYVRLRRGPDRVNEARGYYRGEELSREGWRASNLFAWGLRAESAWTATVTVDGIHDGSYLAVPVFGPHVPEAVYAGARCDGKYLGAARRAISYPSNVFEHCVGRGRSYTYFIPLSKDVEGKPIDVFLLGNGECAAEEIRAEAWVTAYPPPHVAKHVVLRRG